MTREELKQSGLLDQYVLGLLGPEQAGEVEALLTEDPLLEAEVQRLRRDLNSYADAQRIEAPPGGRRLRTAQEFQDLDHEMITAMMERNHSLNIWRYILVGVCVVLVGLAGYLFRLKESYRGELIREEALHAQDAAVYEYEVQRSQEAVWDSVQNWHGLHRKQIVMGEDTLYVHRPARAKVILVDLSAIRHPGDNMAYYLFSGREEDHPEEVAAGRMHLLYALPIEEQEAQELRIFEWPHGLSEYPLAGSQPLLRVDLSDL